MDKRKQFQLQLLSTKLAEYTTKLANLKSNKSQLSNNCIQDLQTNDSLDNRASNRLDLLEQKTILEARIQEYKNNLTNHRNEYTLLNNNQKLLPGQLETSKKQELDIYNEEIQNIEGRIQEANLEHLDKLASLEVDKSDLCQQIQDLQNQLEVSRYNLSSIQESAHAYRKNTIQELKQKKQEKIAITTTLDELNKAKEVYNTNITDVSTRLDNLIALKTQLIDAHYNNSGNRSNSTNLETNLENILNITNARELLPEELLSTIYANSTEFLNAMISYLDKQIQEARYQLSSISKKAIRLDKTITTTSNELKSKQEPTSREKVVSYKDNYKNAKLVKTELEERLYKLQAKLDSWDVEVIENAKLEYKILLDSLEAEKQRAKDRLDIMTSRIIQEHDSNIITLANRIKQVEAEVIATNNLLKQTNQELTTLLEEIAKNNSTQIELDKINSQIANVESAIEKIELDIASLSS